MGRAAEGEKGGVEAANHPPFPAPPPLKKAVNKENDTWQVVNYGRSFKEERLTVAAAAARRENNAARIPALEELCTEC